MTALERGKRIKEARISKKMTQSEVVGDFITRNMLSQIESGTATPSVKTLEYLAETLDIPISELMPSTGSELYEDMRGEARGEQNVPLEKLMLAKELYSAGRYREAAAELGSEQDYGGLSDEFYAVKARCLYMLAKELTEEDTVKAVEYAKESAALSERGFYANAELKAEAVKLVSVLAEKLAKYYAGLISEIP